MLDGADDPFKTAELRGRVLDGWAASAARFREDANAEEDYALGGYRDRVVVELAQNAADAAARAGVPGRLRLTLRDGILVAANTGAPLDAAGVEALSTLRASSKRGQDAVGRFGVGFAAVAAVSDAPRMSSVTGSVQWSREDTRELVRQVPALAGELAERSGHVPVLRLPFPADGTAPDGFATAVTLPLRDSGARELAERLLAQAARRCCSPCRPWNGSRSRPAAPPGCSRRRATATTSRSPSTGRPAAGAPRPRAAGSPRGCSRTGRRRSGPARRGRCAGRCR